MGDWLGAFPEAIAADVAELGTVTQPVNTGLATADDRLTGVAGHDATPPNVASFDGAPNPACKPCKLSSCPQRWSVIRR